MDLISDTLRQNTNNFKITFNVELQNLPPQ